MTMCPPVQGKRKCIPYIEYTYSNIWIVEKPSRETYPRQVPRLHIQVCRKMQCLARVVFSMRLYSYYVTVLVLVFCRLHKHNFSLHACFIALTRSTTRSAVTQSEGAYTTYLPGGANAGTEKETHLRVHQTQ